MPVPGRGDIALAEAGKSYMEWRWPPRMGAEAESVGAVAGARGASKPHGPEYGAKRSTARSLPPASRVRVAGEDGGCVLGGTLGDVIKACDAVEARYAKSRYALKARKPRSRYLLLWFDTDGANTTYRRPRDEKSGRRGKRRLS